jgi:hypothetical protein
MSPEPSVLSRKWFALAAVESLLLAALAALFFLPSRRNAAVQPLATRVLNARQIGPDGELIPWGKAMPENSVRLEVTGLDPGGSEPVEFSLSKDGAPFTEIEHHGNFADVAQLQPGKYRWSALIHQPNGDPLLVEPPRGDPFAPDFVISPELTLPPLRQHTLDGGEIGPNLQTKYGALLGTVMPYDVPGALLEVETKPAAGAFDGTGLQRIPAHAGDISASFVGPDGAYHWRARLVLGSDHQTEWRNFAEGSAGNFIIFNPPEEKQNPPKDTAADQDHQPRDARDQGDKNSDKTRTVYSRTGPSSAPYSSGMGSGHHEPRPPTLKQKDLPSIWHRALYRIARLFGIFIAVLAVMAAALKLIHLSRRRTPQPR